MLLEHKVISPHAIKTLYVGETKADNTLLGLIDYHNNIKTILSGALLKTISREGSMCIYFLASGEFWKQIKATVEEVVNAKMNQTIVQPPHDHLPEKALLKASGVCAVFQISKPTLYDWLKQEKLKSFKIKSRRYFLRTDIENMILNHDKAALQAKI